MALRIAYCRSLPRLLVFGQHSFTKANAATFHLQASGVTWQVFSTSATFQPPEPPRSKGMPVFPDVKLTNSPSSEASKRNTEPNAVFVVTGASRGIGLQCVKSLIERTEGNIVACSRNQSPELTQVITTHGDRISFVPLDLEKQSTIKSAAETIQRRFGRVYMLFNVAGILGDASTTPGPERSLLKLDRKWLEMTLAINTIGPLMFSKEIAPMMKTKARGRSKEEKDQPTSVIVNVSARVGSISDNELGGWYSYRLSKAALNQGTRTMAHELKRQGTWAITFHPGTTDTSLSRPFQKNVAEGRLFPVEFTVGKLLDLVDNLEEIHSGGLYDWAGNAISF